MFVAISIYGVDEEPINEILDASQVSLPIGMCDLYEGHAYVKVCGTREAAEEFLAKYKDEDEDEEDEDVSYMIVRFFQDDRPKEIIKRGLTLKEAQDHCNCPKTHGEGWFDGYEQE